MFCISILVAITTLGLTAIICGCIEKCILIKHNGQDGRGECDTCPNRDDCFGGVSYETR